MYFKRYLLVLMFVSVSGFMFADEPDVLETVITKIKGVISTMFDKNQTKKTDDTYQKISINDLDRYANVQSNLYVKLTEKKLDEKIEKGEADPNTYIEKSLISSIKGDKAEAKVNIEKAFALSGKKSSYITDIKNKLKNVSENNEESIKEIAEEFVFDESLVAMLSGEFTDQYELSVIKVAMISNKSKSLSEKDIEKELESIAKNFYSKISNSFEAKEFIERCINEGEYALGVKILDKSFNDKLINDDYYNDKKNIFESLIAEETSLRMEAEKRAKGEEEFLKKLAEEEEKKKLAIKKLKDVDADKMIQWVSLIGSELTDTGQSIAIGVDGIYITGSTYGNLYEDKNLGDSDVYVSKLDFEGNRVWSKQFGSKGSDGGTGIIVADNSLYITGFIRGDIDDQKSIGDNDMFVAKMDLDGNRIWTKIIGSSDKDRGEAIAVGQDGIFVAGVTRGVIGSNKLYGMWDIFVTKLDFFGNIIWGGTIGSPNHEEVKGLSVINDNVFVVGNTLGDVDGNKNTGFSDILLVKYDISGKKIWTRVFGSDKSDYGNSVYAGIEGIYLTGETQGDIDGNKNNGGSDMFLTKFDLSGNKIWTRTLGSTKNELGFGLFVRLDGVYVTGRTKGDIGSLKNIGGADILFAKYDLDGGLVYSKLFGSKSDDECYGIAVGLNYVYITGQTRGDLYGEKNNGNTDIFVMMISEDL